MKAAILIVVFMATTSLATATAPTFSVPDISGKYASLKRLAVSKAFKYGVRPDIFLELIGIESSWKVRARSRYVGAKGLGQLMEATAKWMCDLPAWKIYHPDDNLDCSARYIRYLFLQKPRYIVALTKYNIGEGNYRRGKNLDAGRRYVNKFSLTIAIEHLARSGDFSPFAQNSLIARAGIFYLTIPLSSLY